MAGEKRPDLLKGRFFDRIFGALFAEELGAVIQIRRDSIAKEVQEVLRAAGLVRKRTSFAIRMVAVKSASVEMPKMGVRSFGE